MNVYGIGRAAAGLVQPRPEPATRPATERAPVAPSRGTPTAAPATTVLTPRAPSLQSEAPAGTDPELWSVLSAEERAFFARAGGIGPLTYSHTIHSGQPATAVMRGGRIDVRA